MTTVDVRAAQRRPEFLPSRGPEEGIPEEVSRDPSLEGRLRCQMEKAQGRGEQAQQREWPVQGHRGVSGQFRVTLEFTQLSGPELGEGDPALPSELPRPPCQRRDSRVWSCRLHGVL